MDLQEATIAMAYLMKNEIDFYKKNLEGVEPTKKLLEEFEWIKSNTREFGNRLAANPNFFNVMESWKVYILGKEGVNEDSIQKAAETFNVEDLVEQCGNLAISIKEFISSKGLIICDIGAGTDGWDIGVRCTEKISQTLCYDVHKKFWSAINLKLIAVSRRFAGHSLPGLYTWDDAEKILKICGE